MNYNRLLIANFARASASALTAALLFTVGILPATAGPVEDTKEATKLYQQGRFDLAMAKVNAALAQQPKDAQGRFLKGLILTEQKKTADAIQVFTGLTEDFPELPEPYNNLAVLYAGQGNYDKAKASLELAIHTHPSYATAYENLGDIYAQLARRSYDKVLQLDKTNTSAQSKLAMVKDLFGGPGKGPAVVAAAPTAIVSPPPTATTSASPSATSTSAVTTKPEPTQTTKPATGGSPETQVAQAVQAWARAWSSRNVDAYFSHYASDFTPPDGMNRVAWEAQRRDRIGRAKSISVEVQMKQISISGNEATAVFRQLYRSDAVKSDNAKTLKLVRAGDKWFIRSEKAGK